jgi:Raf kinase inhibitor-like YbhB/YbcL family protein
MTSRRLIAALLGLLAAGLLAVGCGEDDGGTTSAGPTTTAMTGAEPNGGSDLTLTSDAFADGEELATKYTCDGAGVSPPLEIEGVPKGTAELVLVVSDPDASDGTFTHATAYGIDPTTESATESSPPAGSTIGGNDGDGDGYVPPCPPEGDGPHRYEFTLYALDAPSELLVGATPEEVEEATDANTIASATLTGTYER